MTAPAQVLQQQTGAAVQEGARRTGLADQPPFGTPGKHKQARILQKLAHGQVSSLRASPCAFHSITLDKGCQSDLCIMAGTCPFNYDRAVPHWTRRSLWAKLLSTPGQLILCRSENILRASGSWPHTCCACAGSQQHSYPGQMHQPRASPSAQAPAAGGAATLADTTNDPFEPELEEVHVSHTLPPDDAVRASRAASEDPC